MRTKLLAVAYFILSISSAKSETLSINDAFSTASNWTLFTTSGGTLGPSGALSIVQVTGLNGGGPAGTAAQFEVANGGGGIEQSVNVLGGTGSFVVNIASLGVNPYSVTFTLMVDGAPYSYDSGHETFASPPSPLFISSEALSASYNLSAGLHMFGILMTNNSPDAAVGVNPYEYVGNFNINGFGLPGSGSGVSATPLPPTWGMMLLGLGVLGFMGYWRKRNDNVIATA